MAVGTFCTMPIPRSPSSAVMDFAANLIFDASITRCDVGWSPCGRYMHLTSGVHMSEGLEMGFIWDSVLKMYVHQADLSVLELVHVTWSTETKQCTQRTTCLVMAPETKGTLLLLPSLSGSSAAEKLRFPPPAEHGFSSRHLPVWQAGGAPGLPLGN